MQAQLHALIKYCFMLPTITSLVWFSREFAQWRCCWLLMAGSETLNHHKNFLHCHHRHHNPHHHRNHYYRWLLNLTVETLVVFNAVLHAAWTQQQSVNNNGSRVPILGIMMAVLCVVQWGLVSRDPRMSCNVIPILSCVFRVPTKSLLAR